MIRNRISLLVVGLIVLTSACQKTKFAADENTQVEDPVQPAKPVDPDPLDPKTTTTQIEDTDPSKPLTVDKIEDQQVNSGDLSSRYSEEMRVPFSITGGVAPISVSYEFDGPTDSPLLDGNEIAWTPGSYEGGKYDPQLGQYTVRIIATDSTDATAQSSFSINVVPIVWSSTVKSVTDNKSMIVDYQIIEKLHPKREYNHNDQYRSMNLNSKTCKSFSGGTDITLEETPTIKQNGGSKKIATGYQHDLRMTMKHALSAQPHDKTVYVTRINYLYLDDSVEANPDKGIFIYYAFARCRGSDLSQSECRKQAILSGGLTNFYYCSDYIETDLATDTKRIYCGISAHNGLTPPEC